MKRVCGLFALILLALMHFALLFFACVHWNNWWSLFVWLPFVVALIVPCCCSNYSNLPPELQTHAFSDFEDFLTCRQLGWVFSAAFCFCCYLPPVLAWYNDRFPWPGVLVVFGSVLCLHWPYMIWLRIFVFKNI